ncbi:hypothetical protein [Aureimonas sp. SA4125]|nr:hypothetical protein [Aureimonas sp. SA4125]
MTSDMGRAQSFVIFASLSLVIPASQSFVILASKRRGSMPEHPSPPPR